MINDFEDTKGTDSNNFNQKTGKNLANKTENKGKYRTHSNTLKTKAWLTQCLKNMLGSDVPNG